MRGPIVALIVPLGEGIGGIGGIGGVDPGFGNRPIHHPGHPDHGLPSQPGHPSQPIYHPGHPDHGLPAHPDQGLPPQGSGGSPSHPIHIPGVPDQGLPPPEEIPPDGITDPDLPEGYDDQLVIAVKAAGGDDWEYHAYNTDVSAGTPLPPTPAPKGRRG
jgi:hypothetical protein